MSKLVAQLTDPNMAKEKIDSLISSTINGKILRKVRSLPNISVEAIKKCFNEINSLKIDLYKVINENSFLQTKTSINISLQIHDFSLFRIEFVAASGFSDQNYFSNIIYVKSIAGKYVFSLNPDNFDQSILTKPSIDYVMEPTISKYLDRAMLRECQSLNINKSLSEEKFAQASDISLQQRKSAKGRIYESEGLKIKERVRKLDSNPKQPINIAKVPKKPNDPIPTPNSSSISPSASSKNDSKTIVGYAVIILVLIVLFLFLIFKLYLLFKTA